VDTVVILSRTTWEEPPRIRHQVAEALCRDYRVVFVEVPKGWARHGLRRFRHRRVREEFHVVSLSNLVLPPGRVHDAVGPWRRWVRRIWSTQAEAAVRSLASGRVALLNFAHDFPGLMTSQVFDAAVYFCNDDWVGLAPARLRGEAAALEAATARAAGCCFAVSYPLRDRILSFNPRTELLIPGHFPAATAARWRQPAPPYRLCYVGYLNERLERDWLAALLREPDWEVHLVGALEPGFGGVRDLEPSGRLFLHGELRGEPLRLALGAADVLSLPYRHLPATLPITAPNKLMQYLAAGKPVVASALPHLLELPEHCLARADSAERFVAQARRAVETDCADFFEQRLRIAAQHTWEQKGRHLKDRIDALFP
jgi:glycosyltransferase involved in cell wall biosynthesis